jgi:hypothetical protein
MPDSVSVIQLTTREVISVENGIDELSRELDAYFEPGVAPFMKIEDRDGGFHLINVNEIVHIEGPK